MFPICLELVLDLDLFSAAYGNAHLYLNLMWMRNLHEHLNLMWMRNLYDLLNLMWMRNLHEHLNLMWMRNLYDLLNLMWINQSINQSIVKFIRRHSSSRCSWRRTKCSKYFIKKCVFNCALKTTSESPVNVRCCGNRFHNVRAAMPKDQSPQIRLARGTQSRLSSIERKDLGGRRRLT